MTISGNTVNTNGGDGIYARGGANISGNTVTGNDGYGSTSAYPPTSAFRENLITSNTKGTVTGGVNLGANYCAGTGVVSSSCP